MQNRTHQHAVHRSTRGNCRLGWNNLASLPESWPGSLPDTLQTVGGKFGASGGWQKGPAIDACEVQSTTSTATPLKFTGSPLHHVPQRARMTPQHDHNLATNVHRPPCPCACVAGPVGPQDKPTPGRFFGQWAGAPKLAVAVAACHQPERRDAGAVAPVYIDIQPVPAGQCVGGWVGVRGVSRDVFILLLARGCVLSMGARAAAGAVQIRMPFATSAKRGRQ